MLRRKIEDELVPFAIKNSKSILAYSPLQRGVLTGKMNPGYKFAEGDNRSELFYFSDDNIKRTNEFLAKIKPLADDKNTTITQVVIRWTLEQPGITIALVGARNPNQARENAKAADIKLSIEEIDYIAKELNSLELIK